MIWNLSGLTPEERTLIEDVLKKIYFDWEKLRPKLLAETSKTTIPVEFIDLSRYSETKDADPITYRERTLGLAWYSGKVSIEKSLVGAESKLAQEVFISEGAHMIDFFYMTDQMRLSIYNAYHANDTTEHGHAWFDSGEYWSWVGESFMGGFITSMSDWENTNLSFSHKETPAIIETIRRELGYTKNPQAVYYGTTKGKVYHTANHNIRNMIVVDITNRRQCKICKPA